ncbi:hypothetical protein BCR34DRAFT_567083, partial [Clohesyomyces aquaticus]
MDYSQTYGVLLCVALTTIVVLALKLCVSSPHGRWPKYTTKKQAECAQIIAGSVLNGAKNTLSKLEARARANTRLSHAFGIDNAFTTENTKWHSEYRTKVTTHIRPDWEMVARDAILLAKRYQYPQNLVRLVQCFVLEMTIKILYRGDLSTPDEETVLFVATEINQIWIQSKDPRQIVPWRKQRKLHEALGRLIPGCDALDPQSNPMSFLLPAFETMWRVVLRCFIEVRFRGSKDTNEWANALKTYLENPNPPCDRPEERVGMVVTFALVREALRLYPPTRHVHRHFKFAGRGSSILAIADIEGLHRDEEVWGPDADCFRPSRWESLSPESEQLKAWMPFGGSPFVCPAKPEFGPRMIGILVAALVEVFSDVKFELRLEGPRGRMDMAEFH